MAASSISSSSLAAAAAAESSSSASSSSPAAAAAAASSSSAAAAPCPQPGTTARTSSSSHKKDSSSNHSKSNNDINLRLILVSGKTKDFPFLSTDSAGDIAKYVFDHWPDEWSDETVSSPEILRLIYQGRFLHGNVTLSALGLPFGKTTVMHLVPRESLPEPNSQDNEKKKKLRSRRCCTCSLI